MSSTSPEQRLHYFTPLRYPGGKAKLAAFVKAIINTNDLADGHYVEPYAGGAGVALELLFHEHVRHIHINDISRPIYCFWNAVLNQTDSLLKLIADTPLTVSSWDKQKAVLSRAADESDLDVGFAAFFLNRTNRSGILSGGIIGGRDQSGPWKIDARYNSAELSHRISSVASLKSRITLTSEDAISFLRKYRTAFPLRTLIYLDPPYYLKGKKLYLNSYTHEDHAGIAKLVRALGKRFNWIVSYDNVPQIRKLYRGEQSITYELGYSARETRTGSEVMYFSENLSIPNAAGPMEIRRRMISTT